MQTYHSNQLLIRVGVYLYAAAILALGIIYFTGHHALSGLIPIGGSVLFRNIWGYIFGIILTLFGFSLLIPGLTRQSSFLLGVFLFVILLFVHLPLILLNPANPNDWTSLMEMACLSAGAFILSDVLLPLDAPNEGLSRVIQGASQIARVVFSLALFGFAILHFKYADFIGTLIPAWLPARVFLAYFVGICFFGAGISVVFRRVYPARHDIAFCDVRNMGADPACAAGIRHAGCRAGMDQPVQCIGHGGHRAVCFDSRAQADPASWLAGTANLLLLTWHHNGSRAGSVCAPRRKNYPAFRSLRLRAE